MIIESNKVVSVNYKLTAKKDKTSEEAHIETADDSHPFVFLFGAGGLLEAFEKNLGGKKVGDGFDFYIDAANAYGLHDENHIVSIPVDAFHDDKGKFDSEHIQLGKIVPMMDNHGNRLQGLVKEITIQHVRMDFNHPLAGHELHFVGKVLEIRNATPDELSHGHVHGPGGHHH